MSNYDFTLKHLELSSGEEFGFYSLAALESETGSLSRFPFSIKILLESLLRMQGHPAYSPEHVASFAQWPPKEDRREEYPFLPARILLQDFTGVPAVVDIAALRSALKRNGLEPGKIEPQIPVDLIIDHSVQTDQAGSKDALEYNMEKEFERNSERYRFLRWGQNAFNTLRVLPPGLGICHQINMEYLATCVACDSAGEGSPIAYPDTLVGTDSHTVMINSMGVLGWGVGGIEAEAAMLGQPIPILSPSVTGMKLTGEPQPGVTATDIALRVVQILREIGVVGRFIEYFGPGVDHLTLADRAPIANMAPEYGATMGFFPVDNSTLQYMRETGRDERRIDLVERYCKEQGLWHGPNSEQPEYEEVVELDLSTVEPSVAGPRKPHERIGISELGKVFEDSLETPVKKGGFKSDSEPGRTESEKGTLKDGDIVIASITSCTNTAIPSLMLSAALMARKAVERGLQVPEHVKTSLAPGSRVVTAYLENAELLEPLAELGFDVVSYGCATCIGNSGPLDPEIENEIEERGIVAASVVSGNRNFEGRIHPLTRANYLASPPLVLAYALAGNIDMDISSEPLGKDAGGNPVYLKDIWPQPVEIKKVLREAADPDLYRNAYSEIDRINPMWENLPADESPVFEWEPESTYVREPPFFIDFSAETPTAHRIEEARVLGFFGDFITTDHISPAGAIPEDSPAAAYLKDNGVAPKDFNSFGSRRGNHEVMMRGTFANIRIRNRLVDREGGSTVYHPENEIMPIYDAAMRYGENGTPLIVVAGRMYGAGSSRDWAAKGTALLGVKAVIAESFERIHRSNLVEMGVLPLEFIEGQNAESLGLKGDEKFTVNGSGEDLAPAQCVKVVAEHPDRESISFDALVRIDTPIELEYYHHGGILQYVLRKIMKGE